MTQQDKIYQNPAHRDQPFVFDDAVAEVFSDMVNRSVPGYATLLGMFGVIAERYVKPDTNVYDLGCSLGASSIAMGRRIKADGCRLIAVDNSAAMIRRCRGNLERANLRPRFELRREDVLDCHIDNASLVCLNLTLQFIVPARRDRLIGNIRKGLLPDGALILAEKTASTDPARQELATDLHLGFKRANGYSDMEISRKRNALENVLIPETAEAHEARLARCGFSTIYPWFSCLDFRAWLALP